MNVDKMETLTATMLPENTLHDDIAWNSYILAITTVNENELMATTKERFTTITTTGAPVL